MAIHFETYPLFWEHLPIISKTPLHRAAANGHMEVVKLLVKCGSDINMKDVSDREMIPSKIFDLDFVRRIQKRTRMEKHSHKMSHTQNIF